MGLARAVRPAHLDLVAGVVLRISLVSVLGESIVWPASEVMVSPAPSPAWAAGPPGTAWARLAPELLALLALTSDAQEGRGPDVHGRGGLAGLDLVGDGWPD